MVKRNRTPALPISLFERIRRIFLGPASNLRDPSVGHKISLIAFFAWVGLGADGLSSSAYGPEEAFRMLGEHTYLAVVLVLATALTVFIISYAYTRIIEHFPTGGGGYVVATELLGKPAGVVSGCALLVDYILTITVSIAAGGDALFSLLPLSLAHWKLPVEFAAIVLLIVMNVRGVKESVAVLTPIFLTFILTHAFLILGGIAIHLADIPEIARHTSDGFRSGLTTLGGWGLFLVFLHAYSLGGGTYTGIEAVSNGVGTLRDPKVQTGKKTMTYMAASLVFTAGGLLLCYMLANVRPVAGQTLNAVLANDLMGSIRLGAVEIGGFLVLITIASEAVLLLVAAQTGFIDGPRVMANMALDSWLPRRFSALSDRLTNQNGILLFGAAAMGMLLYTGGHIQILVVMYSVNVFLTFSLSEIGMVNLCIKNWRKGPAWKRELLVHATGLILCSCILLIMLLEKFREGAWLTVVITAICVWLCFSIRRHYHLVTAKIKELDRYFRNLPAVSEGKRPSFDPEKPTAVILVGGYAGLGKHVFLNIFRHFPGVFKNAVFLNIGVVNSEFFKEGHYIESVERKTRQILQEYVSFSEQMGIPADSAYRIGTDVVETASELCVETAQRFPRTVFFAGELLFENPAWYHRILHNETAYAILRKIQFAGLTMVILPIRIREEERTAA
ncbi:MAG: APC family permease [Candidatus Omnitrophica bacterium]|nr:APC family permease [Candidatus Omnitrophota bacterium]